MDETSVRQLLLSNMKDMCKYTEKELSNTSRAFRFEYERGFIYGWRDYNISFSYNPTKKRAEMAINFYRGHEHFSHDGKVFTDSNAYMREPKDVTEDFINGRVDYVQKAMEITQRNWPRIKEAIKEHKRVDDDIVNFSI